MRVLLALAALPLAASFAPSAVGRRFNHPRHATDCECDAATGAATVGTASVTPALLRGLSLTNAEGAVVVESKHNYDDNSNEFWEVNIPDADKGIEVRFDPQSKTEA